MDGAVGEGGSEDVSLPLELPAPVTTVHADRCSQAALAGLLAPG